MRFKAHNIVKCLRLALYLVLSLMLVFLFYSGKSFVLEQYRHKKIISQFEEIIDITKTYLITHTDYSNLDNSYFKHRAPKNNMVFHPSSNYLENILGGYFFVQGTSSNTQKFEYDSFIVSYQGLLPDECVYLASYDWQKLKNTSVIGILAASFSRNLPWDKMYMGCQGLLIPEKYAVGCSLGENVSIPLSEFQALAVCQCRYDNCSLSLKLN